MKKKIFSFSLIRQILWIAFSLLSISKQLNAQAIDSTYIRSFQKNNHIESFSRWYANQFMLSNDQNSNYKLHLRSNSSIYTGLNINYKWASLSIGTSLKKTALDRSATQLQSFQIQLGGLHTNIGWQLYGKMNHGFLTPVTKEPEVYSTIKTINYTDIGNSLYYLTNYKRFSYQAAKDFSKLQLQSAGSFIFMVNTSYHQFKLTDATTGFDNTYIKSFFESHPQWITGIASAGYRYNAVWQQGKWSISPEVTFGYGKLKMINKPDKLQDAIQFKSNLTFGYNSPAFYSYVTGFYNINNSTLIKESFYENNSGISLVFGYRFPSLKRKILQVL